MSEIMNDHARGCQGREYNCTCGYDGQRDLASRILGDLNPEEADNDRILRDIHLRLQIHGEKYPERMVSVLHRNVVLWAVSKTIEAALVGKLEADASDPRLRLLEERLAKAESAVSRLMAKLADLLDEDHFHACEEIVRIAGVPPVGWQLVPKVPTDKMMILGGFSFAGKVPNDEVFPEVRKLWDKMLTEAAMAGKLVAEK